jgi:guanylate kinase
VNKVIIIAAPSGAGKTTIVKRLLSKDSRLAFSVSATTRSKREGEVDGVDYYFLSEDDFQEKIKHVEFIEYEEVYKGTIYGTLRTEVDRLWNKGKTVVFDIDVAGALSIKNLLKEKALAIFIMPPSKEVLVERLQNRQTETMEKILMRLAKSDKEMNQAYLFDKVVINDDLELAVKQVEEVIEAFLK